MKKGKLTAKYQFEVPPIPMTGWGVLKLEPIKLATESSIVTIHSPGSKDRKPRSYAEPEQKGYTITTTFGSKGRKSWSADTLWIDVEKEVDPEISHKEAQDILHRDINIVLKRFFKLLRQKLPETPISLPVELSYYATISLPSGEYLFITGSPNMGFKLISKEAFFNKKKWAELHAEMVSGVEPEFWEDFIIDANVALEEKDLNRATLYAAIACETFIKQYTKKAAVKRGVSEKFWNYLNSRETDIRAIRYYGPILHLVTGHSLEDEKNELYESLERIFKKRNKIMHEGKRSFSRDERIILINDIGRLKEAISWVLNCSKEHTS